MANIFSLSGPRGVGKSLIMEQLHTQYGIRPIVPYTTRDPRPNEVDGRDYHFVEDSEFDAIRRSVGMFDVLTLKDRKYGTPLEEFEKAAQAADGVVENIRTINLAAGSALELRRQLGIQVVKSIFLLPQCWEDIDTQMREKGIPDNEILARRASEPTDLTMLPDFDRIVINGYRKPDLAIQNIGSYISQVSGVVLA